jgi:transposase
VVEAVMSRPYSIDLRERVIAAVTEGLSVRAVGEIFDVSPSCVSKLGQRWRRSGRIDPLKSGGDRRSGAIESQRDWLLQTIEATPDLTLREIGERLRQRGTSTSKSSIARFFQRHRISRKKKTLHATERDRADVSAARAEWKAQQPEFDAAHLVFLDETSVTTNMARTHGRSPVGERVVGAIPQAHWKTTTFVAALRLNGMTAPMVIDGAMTGSAFLAYVEQQLAPSLSPGDIVVMDNVAMHGVAGVEQAITARGATIRPLPPYSPDMNPIELAFAKLKAMLRRAAARSIRNLWRRIADIIRHLLPQECRNYFAHDGYVCV